VFFSGFESQWDYLNMTASEIAAGGVSLRDTGSRPLLGCDAFGNWADVVGIPHAADWATTTSDYLHHNPGIGSRNFLLTDGSVMRYTGGKAL